MDKADKHTLKSVGLTVLGMIAAGLLLYIGSLIF